ncbi:MULTISPECIES: hypothetical protein [unclassified Streptomyces]|uniref:hypothetical protein n=1 Tax=unclassified Streptomyces TaxID=2593676 RepID=UPI001F5BFC90|nr:MULTISPECIES: hypothetical protein [unclassified Streptomyces]
MADREVPVQDHHVVRVNRRPFQGTGAVLRDADRVRLLKPSHSASIGSSSTTRTRVRTS